jgi:hypothetical protein
MAVPCTSAALAIRRVVVLDTRPCHVLDTCPPFGRMPDTGTRQTHYARGGAHERTNRRFSSAV